MRKFVSTSIALVMIASFVAACGGDDDDDATMGPGGSPTTAVTPAGTGTTSSAASTGTTGGATAEATTTDGSPATEAATTATAGDEGTATEEATAEGTGEATGTSGTTTSGTSTTTSGDVTPEEENLLGLLLTEDEALAILGDSWTETRRAPVEDDEGDSVGICGAAEFPRRDEKIAHVEADWESATGGAFENIVEFPDDVVAEAMEFVRTSVACNEWTDADGDTNTVASWDNPGLLNLGDDVVGIIVTTEVSGAPIDLYVAFVQTNVLITQVMYGDPTADAATAEQTALDLVTASIEKIESE